MDKKKEKGKSQVNLSIIIISYNTCKMTLDCLRSVYNEAISDDYEILVFDNNSSDHSVKEIRREFPDVKLIAHPDNLGFAQGNNECIRQATGKYILLLNPDTVVLNNAIDKLLTFALDNEKAGVWGGKTLFADHSLNPSSCWGRMTLWNQFCRASGLTGLFKNSEFFNSEAYGGWLRDSERKVDIVSGCFFLIKNELWSKLNGFDAKFFMYGEEADFCLRARKLGYEPMVTHKAEIIHYGGASERNESDKMVKLLKAKTMLIRTHWNKYLAPMGVFLMVIWSLTRVIAFSLINLVKNKKQDKQEMWTTVWQKRNQWIKGY